MSETCTHDMEDRERLELWYPEEPLQCDMCPDEGDIGIKYATKLGRIFLCTDCLNLLKHVAEGELEENNE